MNELKELIRSVADFPKPGILFYDITTLLKDPTGLRQTIHYLCEPYRERKIDLVVGIEARGFMFAMPVAYELGCGFIPVRKPRKLPAEIVGIEYELEYGVDRLEMHRDAIEPGQRVLIVDDLLATGGTARAVADLVEQVGGKVEGIACVVELSFLKGRERLNGYSIYTLLQYDQ